MSRIYKLLYRVGFTPWEHMQELPAGSQVTGMLEREEAERPPPFGRALDLGCGSGIWSVRLAERGWEVTGVDIVPGALARARERAGEAGIEARFVEGDIAALAAAGVGSGFDLVLDFGAVHGLTDSQREAVGREVTALANDDATLLMFAMAPGRRGPLPRGMDREGVEATYPDWTVIDEGPFDVSGAPRPMQRAHPRWYRLRRD